MKDLGYGRIINTHMIIPTTSLRKTIFLKTSREKLTITPPNRD